MNIAKNMEFVFVAVLAIAGFTTYATADVAPRAAKTAPAAAAVQNEVATVVVTTKRLTAEEKARLDS